MTGAMQRAWRREEIARKTLANSLITLRNAQVRRISWVRGVRPARGRCEWPPHDTVSRPAPFWAAEPAGLSIRGFRLRLKPSGAATMRMAGASPATAGDTLF